MSSVVVVTLQTGVSIPLSIPNDVIDGDGFYVSHNLVDAPIYGCETTALVRGQMQAFYILNGDHRAAYAELIPLGLAECLAYFKANVALVNKHSDRISGG